MTAIDPDSVRVEWVSIEVEGKGQEERENRELRMYHGIGVLGHWSARGPHMTIFPPDLNLAEHFLVLAAHVICCSA